MPSSNAPATKTKGQANRQRIVEAANDLFYRQGYNRTSFSEVAEASGIPKGNFYYYFKSKEELLDAVIESRLDYIQARLAEWEAECPEPRQRLQRLAQILDNEVDNITAYGCPMGTLNAELGKSQQQANAARMYELYLDWGEAQFRALGKGDESRPLAQHMLAMMQGAAMLGFAGGDRGVVLREAERVRAWLEQQ